jgi:NAD(P)-dependent dehydrogenase (short-subunit alcohol dehydrogenase family)
MMRIQDKVAIVTGSGSGNGRGIALRLAESGADLVVADIDPEGGHETVQIIESRGGTAVFAQTDVTSADQVEQMVQTAVDSLGRLDILVNNAGISPVGSVTEISEEEWDLCLNVDLKSIFLGCKFAIPKMIKSGGGHIVNIAGTLGMAAIPQKAAYCAAKAGAINLTRQMAIDYGPHNIRVNCVSPGFIDTPLTAGVSIQEREWMFSHLSIRRAGRVEDIANAVLYLVAQESGYVTGISLVVDGGQTLSIPALADPPVSGP